MQDENLQAFIGLVEKLGTKGLFVVIILMMVIPFISPILNMIKDSAKSKRDAQAEKEKADALNNLSEDLVDKMDEIKDLFISSMTRLRRNFLDLENSKTIIRLSHIKLEYRTMKSVYNILMVDNFLKSGPNFPLHDKLDTPLLNTYKEGENDLRKFYYNLLCLAGITKRDSILGLIGDIKEKLNISKAEGVQTEQELFNDILGYLNNYFDTQRERAYAALIKTH